MRTFTNPAAFTKRLLAALTLSSLLHATTAAAGTPRPAAKPLVHTVYPGQRLASIARRYQVTVEALRLANGLQGEKRIFPGQKLVIPRAGEALAPISDASLAPQADVSAAAPDDTQPSVARAAPAPARAMPAKALPATSPHDARAGTTHIVAKGQRLGSIAKRYHLSVEELCRINGLNRRETLRVGQKLLITTAAAALPVKAELERAGNAAPPLTHLAMLGSRAIKPPAPTLATPASWLPYTKRPWRRGYIELHGYKETWKGYALGAKGEVLAAAKQHVSRVLSAANNGIDNRLIQLIAKTSDQFGGRPIRVVSGYRERSYARASRHRMGKAMDFSIPGVPNSAVRDFVRTFSNVGVGYYPNSTFVHLDVREYTTYWVDYSRPGQAPIYRLAAGPRAVNAGNDNSAPRNEVPAAGTALEQAHAEPADTGSDESEVELDAPPATEKPAPAAAPTPAAPKPARAEELRN